eukprot:jgi/Orpsp1_1/1190139/evm.model.d7180000076863.1
MENIQNETSNCKSNLPETIIVLSGEEDSNRDITTLKSTSDKESLSTKDEYNNSDYLNDPVIQEELGLNKHISNKNSNNNNNNNNNTPV